MAITDQPTMFANFSISAWMVTACLLLWVVSLIIYRLVLSPIAKFPGSRLAAATGWYEFYYDVVKPGMYIYEIERMHNKYGPIVRVNPTELSIRDPSFYDEIYVGGNVRKTNKHNEFCQGTGLEGSVLLTHDHDLHRQRRRVMDPFFSRASVRKLESRMHSLLRHFEQRLKYHTDTVIRLDHAFVALSGDIIRSITCENVDLLMDDDKWSPHWFDLFLRVVMAAPLFTSFPWIIKIITFVPVEVLTRFYPQGCAFVEFKDIVRAHIVEAKQDKEKQLHPRETDSIFRKIVNLDVPETELDTERLTKEGQALFGAATVAVARALDTIAYHVLASPEMQSRLTSELEECMARCPPDTYIPPVSDLEKLPYLTGVVQEGLRLSYGSMHRMPRVSPTESITYKEWIIPANVPVGMSAYFNHTDPEIFPTPFTFDPARWVGAIDSRMKKALIPFTRGSRVCLGSNLAASELYAITTMLFRPGAPELRLFDTDESDVKSVHDYMIPLPKADTNGVRVLVS